MVVVVVAGVYAPPNKSASSVENDTFLLFQTRKLEAELEKTHN